MNKAYIIAFLVIGMALGFTLWSFSSGQTPYVTIDKARKMSSTVQVRGVILRDAAHPVRYDHQAQSLRFWIKDPNKEEIEVVYFGAKPDAFDTAPGTAASGMIHKENGKEVFVSNNLIIQCPSKYNDQKSVYKQSATS